MGNVVACPLSARRKAALLFQSRGCVIMARLRLKERIARKNRALAFLQLRTAAALHSQMWFWAHVGFIHTLGRLALDDTPTHLPTRDIFEFLSAQDCVNFLRFTRSQVGALPRYVWSR